MIYLYTQKKKRMLITRSLLYYICESSESTTYKCSSIYELHTLRGDTGEEQKPWIGLWFWVGGNGVRNPFIILSVLFGKSHYDVFVTTACPSVFTTSPHHPFMKLIQRQFHILRILFLIFCVGLNSSILQIHNKFICALSSDVEFKWAIRKIGYVTL